MNPLQTHKPGDPAGAGRLLPLVYDELHRLAAQKLARERACPTLEPTELVHEAYLRLVGSPDAQEGEEQEPRWDSRGHFFGAAAEAMRRILVENARRRKRAKHGGGRQCFGLDDRDLLVRQPPDEISALYVALTRLAEEDAEAAQMVQLHFFAGLSIAQAAAVIGVSRATAYRQWSFARCWLRCAVGYDGQE
jgi:RNA polymerase sigma factor (TIGR02999 family)